MSQDRKLLERVLKDEASVLESTLGFIASLADGDAVGITKRRHVFRQDKFRAPRVASFVLLFYIYI